MIADFDHIAKTYDTDFTNSEIGKLQRGSVYGFLKKRLVKNNSKTVLEINCGTGQDAIWWSTKVDKVVATDISREMIEVAKRKALAVSNISFKELDIKKIEALKAKETGNFDLVFSNFGGLNCLSPEELKDFFRSVTKQLGEKGKLILVIMPKNCIWERLYFMLKGKWSKAFRRNTTKAVKVNVKDNEVLTWYFNPKDIKELSKENFKMVTKKPIGFFVPPSYMEPYFSRHKVFLSILGQLEKWISNWGFLSRYADHYIIELEKK